MDSVVVGFDGSPSAAVALRWGEAYGARHGRPVVALLACDERDPDDALGELDAVVAAAVGPASRVRREIAFAEPADALLEAATDASLLVVGTGAASCHLGAVSREVLRLACCPVAVVREHVVGADAAIVVGVDGSGCSRAALRWALDEAGASRREVHALHARTPRVGRSDAGIGFVAPPDRALDDAARADLDDLVAGIERSPSSTPIRRHVVVGRPGTVLLDAAPHAATVVVGARGTGGFDGLLIGTVGDLVASRSPGTVVVVPGTDTAAG